MEEKQNYKVISLLSAYKNGGGIETVVNDTRRMFSDYNINCYYIYGDEGDFKLKSFSDFYKLFKDSDIVHNHIFRIRYMTIFYFLSVLLSTTLLTTIHSTFGLIKNDKLTVIEKGKRKMYILKILIFLFPNFLGSKVSFVSNSVRDVFLSNFRMISEKCVVIYNPVDVLDNNRSTSDFRNGDFAFIGRLEKEKRPQFAIDSFLDYKSKYISSYKINIYGDGRLLKELIDKYRTNENEMIFHGWKKIDVTVWDKICLLLITSEYEGSSLVALEAIARGIPVISTKIPALIELQEYFPELVYISSDNDFSKNINKVISSFPKSTDYKEKFYYLFSAEVYKNKLRNFYFI